MIRWMGLEYLRQLRDPEDEPLGNDNSYHVVTCSNAAQTTLMDGFVVTGGFANGVGSQTNGGGLLASNCSNFLRLQEILFSGNSAYSGRRESITRVPAQPWAL